MTALSEKERRAVAGEVPPWLETAETLVRRFREDRLALTAGSLTFTTIISLVPLITVMLALFSAFPMFATLQTALQKYLLQTLLPDTVVRPVMDAISQFSTRASRLGIVGLIALVVSALAMMLTIDRALNTIWRVRSRRRIGQRVAIYWAAATLGPLVFAISLSATSYAATASRGLLGELPRGLAATVAAFDFGLETIAVAALFRFVPNTVVHWRHALIGGVFVAVCIAGGKRALTAYFGAVPTYALVYGAFATLPIFLIWVYLIWVIILLGAVIAAYAPLVGKHLRRWPDAAGVEFRLALAILGELATARRDGRRGRDADEIADAIGIDPLQLGPVLDVLAGIDWIGRLDETGNARYVLLCDPASTPAEPLVARLLLDPAPDLEATWRRAGFDAVRLEELLPPPLARSS
ncbi:MAG TPA: YihY family inner membrane protein [Caldimonas sp.]|nr:YihY family inner membrane protein [Caldimonas sp.]HEX4233887.1 YihY family inner membrane protein [Caldimonas sp.]